MENTIYISFENDEGSSVDGESLVLFVQKVLAELKLKNWELSILFCSDPFIQKLNKQYRNMDEPTDVLSFEQGCEYRYTAPSGRFAAGDIIISLDTLLKNSQAFNVGADEELKRLIIHGILHLNGMDHSDNSPEQEMLKLQEKILNLFLNIKIYRE